MAKVVNIQKISFMATNFVLKSLLAAVWKSLVPVFLCIDPLFLKKYFTPEII